MEIPSLALHLGPLVSHNKSHQCRAAKPTKANMPFSIKFSVYTVPCHRQTPSASRSPTQFSLGSHPPVRRPRWRATSKTHLRLICQPLAAVCTGVVAAFGIVLA
ncbi:hypothetical protein M441DRAFT_400401 [Trichoderma asperellum CBS 433.97]|uniref:Uncharacterized protein n=1 Tax=Trichoderma asperellum (strain ATCC 204424 / CBS 433.97 / NBRC 101777) TaxID=1042311 RepID=A0A2T3Z9R4_TRIA4|nr:hypothetical protein M441DRAFT_400401 [Trichoderma asperellum CBS 433.97]PTB41530.1 hypothetical protein M441DRAFT_400401 [Trichoderma asperellum CBS 433.97]